MIGCRHFLILISSVVLHPWDCSLAMLFSDQSYKGLCSKQQCDCVHAQPALGLGGGIISIYFVNNIIMPSVLHWPESTHCWEIKLPDSCIRVDLFYFLYCHRTHPLQCRPSMWLELQSPLGHTGFTRQLNIPLRQCSKKCLWTPGDQGHSMVSKL